MNDLAIRTDIKNILNEGKENSFKIYIRLNPTCNLKKVRMFIIIRALDNIGQICFAKPDLLIIESGAFGLDIEIFFISEKSQDEILLTLEEILEIENKVITKISSEEFLEIYDKNFLECGETQKSLGNSDHVVEKASFSEGGSNIDIKSNTVSQENHSFKINNDQRDALQEVGNIGAGNAANALARMIDRRVDINVPTVNSVKFQKYSEFLNREKNKLLVMWSEILGDLTGRILILSRISDILQLASLLMGVFHQQEDIINIDEINFINDFSELYQSAFNEIVLILSSQYSMALSSLLGLNLSNSLPELSIDTGDQLYLLLKEKNVILDEEGLTISTDLIIRDVQCNIKIIFLPDHGTLRNLLNVLNQYL